MSDPYSPLIEERLNSTFVLTSSLYFKLVVADPACRDPRMYNLHAVLHNTARDLIALSECPVKSLAALPQLLSGTSAAIHGLRDLAELADEQGQSALRDQLVDYVMRLEDRVRL